MKSPRMLLQRRKPHQQSRGGFASDADDDDEREDEGPTGSTVPRKSRYANGRRGGRSNNNHDKLKSIPSRTATKTDSSSSYGDDEEESPNRSVDEGSLEEGDDRILEESKSDDRTSNDDDEEPNEDDEDDRDDEACSYSAGSEYSDDPNDSEKLTRRMGRKKSRVLQALNLRRVFSQRRKKRRQLSEGEDDGSEYSGQDSCSYESSFRSDDLDTAGDEDAEDAVAAAEALRQDLEAMGYNLDCESFITKGSSEDASEERYVPPSRKKKKKKKKGSKKRVANFDDEVDAIPESMPAGFAEELQDKEIQKSRSGSKGSKTQRIQNSGGSADKSATSKSQKSIKLETKSKKSTNSDDRQQRLDPEPDAEAPDCEKDVRDVAAASNDAEGDASIGSLSNPSDVLDRSLRTNTSSKLKESKIGPLVNKYGRPSSPVNMESLASLRELVEITKRHKKTIPPPAMAKPEKSKSKQHGYDRHKEKQAKDDHEDSIAAMSGLDKNERRGNAADDKHGRDNEIEEEKESLRKSGSRHSPPPLESVHTPVIIEGMSVLLGRNDSLASELPRQRHEGMPPYKHLAPDPPEEEDTSKVALSPNRPVRTIQTKQPTPLTRTTVLSSPDVCNPGDSLMEVPQGTVETARKRFFGLSVGRRTHKQEARVPNLPQTPRTLEAQHPRPMDNNPRTPKTPRTPRTPKFTDQNKEPSGKKFQLPAPILTKEDPVGVQVRERTPFKLPTSMKESMMSSSKDRGFDDDDCPFPIPDGVGMEKSPMAKVRPLSSPAKEQMKILPASPATLRLGGLMQAARNTLSPRKAKGVDRFFATAGSGEFEEETLAPGQIEVTFNNSVAGSDLVPVAKLDPQPPPPRKWLLPLSPRSLASLPPPPPPPPPQPLSVPATHHPQVSLPEVQAPTTKARNPLSRLFRMQSTQQGLARAAEPANMDEEARKMVHNSSKSTQLQKIEAEVVPAPQEQVGQQPLEVEGHSTDHAGTFPDTNTFMEKDRVKSTSESTFDTWLLSRSEEKKKSRVIESVNLYSSRGKRDKKQDDNTYQSLAKQSSEPPTRVAAQKPESFDRARPEPLTQTDRLTATVKDIVTAVFLPELNVDPPVPPSRSQPKGLLNDWFNLDLLGNMDWATRNNEGSTQRKHVVPPVATGHNPIIDDEAGLETNSIIDPSSMLSTSRHQTQVSSTSKTVVDPRLLQIVHGQMPAEEPNTVAQPMVTAKDPPPTNLPWTKPDPIDTRETRKARVHRIPEPSPMTVEPSVKAEIAEVKPMAPAALETVVEGLPMEAKPAKGLFKRLRSYNKNRLQEDRMSTGISSSEPSSFYPVEFNDDNDFRAAKPRPSLSSGPSQSLASGSQQRSLHHFEAPPRHRVPPAMPESPYAIQPPLPPQQSLALSVPHQKKTAALKSKATVRSDAAINQSRADSRIPHSPTMSTYPGGVGDPSYSMPSHLMTKSFLASDASSSVDTWAEIADASMVVERAMERLDTFRSEDTEDPAKLKYLLSVVSDDDTIGDVEKALNVLKKHASRLGVKETDLLMAVGSHETPISLAETETRSFKSLTLGEELMNVFNLFVKPHHDKRQRKSRRHYHL